MRSIAVHGVEGVEIEEYSVPLAVGLMVLEKGLIGDLLYLH